MNPKDIDVESVKIALRSVARLLEETITVIVQFTQSVEVMVESIEKFEEVWNDSEFVTVSEL